MWAVFFCIMLQGNDIAGRLLIPMTKLPRALFQPIRGKATGYAAAVGLALLATLVRLASDHMLPPGFPFLTFFPAVILTTFLAGRGPGWVCAVLSLLSSWYFFIPPLHSFVLDRQVFTALIFFSFVVIVDVLLIDGLLQRQRQLVENQRELSAMAEQQTLLFKELQHRVANNLASIASMLRIQRRQIERDPASALPVIDSADTRIELMGRVHRQLYDPAARGVTLPEQIGKVVDQTRAISAAPHVSVTVNAVDARLAVDRMMTLMLLITEVMTNSIKHAFPDGQPGEIRLTLDRVAENRLRLTIADNGCGMAPSPAPSANRPKGLGSAIIRGFAAQLSGTVNVDGGNGVTTIVEFPETPL